MTELVTSRLCEGVGERHRSCSRDDTWNTAVDSNFTSMQTTIVVPIFMIVRKARGL